MIEARNLSKTYNSGRPDEVKAIVDVSLKVEEGTIAAFTGPSGCGKSTLLGMLGLILTPTSGRILLNGEDITAYSDYHKTILRRKYSGFIFQHINLLPGYSAIENTMLPLLCRNEDVEKYRSRALQLLDRLHLSGRADHKVEQLSGGEQQRVAFVRALMVDPEYLFTDEPTVFVDEESCKIIRDTFQSLRKEGKVIFLATHDQNLLSLADRIFRMSEGLIISEA